MCELTFVNTHNEVLNRIATYLLTAQDSVANPDGVGIYSLPHGIWTSIASARNITNYGDLLNKYFIKSNLPVIAHTRLASKGVKVEVENVHPFEFPNLVGAHNGTVYFEDEKEIDSYYGESRESDSKRLFQLLDKKLTEVPNFITALNDVMETVRGKFALLIYDKRPRKKAYYAVRGSTADLHYCNVMSDSTGEVLGYIINTKKYDLESCLQLINNIFQLMGGEKLKFSAVIELKKETIFKLEDKEIVEVGTCIENPLIVATQIVAHTYGMGSTTSSTEPVLSKNIKLLADFATREDLSPRDIEVIFQTIYGVPLLQITGSFLEHFVTYAIPVLSNCKRIKDTKASRKLYYIPHTFYEKYKLQFPLGTNNNKFGTVITALEDYAKALDQSRMKVTI